MHIQRLASLLSKNYDVKVRLGPEQRDNLADLQRLSETVITLVALKQAGLVPSTSEAARPPNRRSTSRRVLRHRYKNLRHSLGRRHES